jgi:hypothetical protein
VHATLQVVDLAAPPGPDELAALVVRACELESVAELEGQVPRVLEEGTDPEGRPYLVVSALPGSESRAFTGSHARFLASLGKARFRATDFEVSGCCQWLQRGLRRLESGATPAVAPLSRKARATLEQAYHDCETSLLYWTGPYVLSQGDFAPWNIRNLGSQLFVTDWGQAHAEASPLDDVLHYLMIQRALNARPVSVPVLRQAMRRAADFAVQAYPEWSWRAPVIGALTLVYLLGVVLHRSLARRRLDRTDRVIGAYCKLLEKRAAWMPL